MVTPGVKAGQYRELPGPRAERAFEGLRDYAVTAVQNDLVFLDHGGFDGIFVKDVDGNEYLDFFSGAGVSNLGHNHKTVRNAVVDQVFSGAWQFDESVMPNQIANRLRVRLAEAAPGFSRKKVFLCNSGAEANDTAVKVLFANRPGAKYVLSCQGAFHGRTGYSLALTTSKEVHHKGFPFAFDNPTIPFPGFPGALDPFFAKVGKSLPASEIAGIFIELVQGEGGINVADLQEVKRLDAWCKDKKVPLVVDDVQAAFGRTGTLFSAQHYGIEPDITTLAKALGGGAVPIGAAVIRADLDFKEQGRHANTNGGNMIACAAAHAVLDVLDDHPELLENARQMGELLHNCLLLLEGEKFQYGERGYISVANSRGLGLFRGCDIQSRGFRSDRSTLRPDLRDGVVAECAKRGLLVEGAGEAAVRFEPPLIVTEEQIGQAVEIFDEALVALASKI